MERIILHRLVQTEAVALHFTLEVVRHYLNGFVLIAEVRSNFITRYRSGKSCCSYIETKINKTRNTAI